MLLWGEKKGTGNYFPKVRGNISHHQSGLFKPIIPKILINVVSVVFASPLFQQSPQVKSKNKKTIPTLNFVLLRQTTAQAYKLLPLSTCSSQIRNNIKQQSLWMLEFFQQLNRKLCPNYHQECDFYRFALLRLSMSSHRNKPPVFATKKGKMCHIQLILQFHFLCSRVHLYIDKKPRTSQ